jgi:hypothetical protein
VRAEGRGCRLRGDVFFGGDLAPQGLLGEEGDRKGGDMGGAPLEVAGDPVLEAQGRVDLPPRYLLLQDAAWSCAGTRPRAPATGH